MALLVSLFSYEAIFILTPRSYHGATDIVIVLAMFYGLLFFGKTRQLLFAKKTGLITLISFATFALNVALNIPFIMKWGAIGAAWATFLSGAIASVIHFLLGQRYYKIHWEYQRIGERDRTRLHPLPRRSHRAPTRS